MFELTHIFKESVSYLPVTLPYILVIRQQHALKFSLLLLVNQPHYYHQLMFLHFFFIYTVCQLPIDS
jgi:hypothetical protein